MIILGLCGKMQSGKDAIAEMIADYLYKKNVNLQYKRVSFADSLKKEIAFAALVSPQYINEHKDNFRLIMQGWGTDFRRKLCGEDYWLKRWLQSVTRLPNDTLVVCPDVRFINEYETIQKVGGTVWCIKRPNISCEDKHVSETELECIHATHRGEVIRNEFDLGYLRQIVETKLVGLLNSK